MEKNMKGDECYILENLNSEVEYNNKLCCHSKYLEAKDEHGRGSQSLY